MNQEHIQNAQIELATFATATAAAPADHVCAMMQLLAHPVSAELDNGPASFHIDGNEAMLVGLTINLVRHLLGHLTEPAAKALYGELEELLEEIGDTEG